MLSNEHIAIVKSTVPLLEAGGEALTTHFYRIMLAEYPQVRPLFNQAHQASGDQPRALANGVLMYAKHIDRLQALGPLVGQIVQKHVSLQILPEHYPIVGSCLLRAIREVLGAEVATDAVIAAWAAAYGQLADLLIGAEEEVYAATERAAGGWRGGRAFRVVGKVRESEEITSFHLQPADGGALLDFIPGQYIGLRLWLDGEEVRRNYSLSQAANGRDYRISVKREPRGQASNLLHDHLHIGDTVDIMPPAGDFFLQEVTDTPVVLISAGVGLTPMLSMLNHLLAEGPDMDIRWLHACEHGAHHAFRDEIRAKSRQHGKLESRIWYREPGEQDVKGEDYDFSGTLALEQVTDLIPADAHYYFCGPVPFMKAVKAQLENVGVPAERMHYEVFGPHQGL